MKSKSARKFGRVRKVRRALTRSLAASLFERGSITTTLAKAKETRPIAEKLVTLGKRGGLNDRRLIARSMSSSLVKKICDDIAPRYKDRNGGYTRVVKIGPRKSDGAEMAKIMFI